MITSQYLAPALSGKSLHKIASDVCKIIKNRGLIDQFDSIAIRGVSGALVGSVVAARLRKDLIVVRKNSDNHHSDLLVEGNLKSESYIIIDDFIASGHTISQIIMRIWDNNPDSQCLGIILYKHEFFDRYIMRGFVKNWNCWITSTLNPVWFSPKGDE